jgi:hypothetical protein
MRISPTMQEQEFRGPFAAGKLTMSISSKTFTTTLGDITLKRACYYCSSCGHGCFPKDNALGFGNFSLSPGVTRMIGLVASPGPFQEGTNRLRELVGIPLPTSVTKETPSRSVPSMYVGVDETGISMCPNELADRPGKQTN